jgi:DNA-binding NarL/FixJ family response regulator
MNSRDISPYANCHKDAMTRTLLVVDDHHLTRAGLRVLAQSADLADVEWLEAASLDEALARYAGCVPRPDLVLLDLRLPDSLGLQGLRRFLAEFPQARIAVFSGSEDTFVMRQALTLGAIGFIPKTADADSARAAIVGLLDGRRSAADRPATTADGHGANGTHGVPTHGPSTDGLTATQLKVLELLLAGLSNTQIANELGLAVSTVKNAVSSVMLKFDVRSRSHLISLFR